MRDDMQNHHRTRKGHVVVIPDQVIRDVLVEVGWALVAIGLADDMHGYSHDRIADLSRQLLAVLNGEKTRVERNDDAAQG